MEVKIVLDPQVEGYQELLGDLREELHALEGVRGLKYEEATAPAPPNVLSVEHDVANFIVQQAGPLLLFATALLQILHSCLDRRNIAKQENHPPAVLVVGNMSLKVPASPGAEKRFLSRVEKARRHRPEKRGKRTKKNVNKRAKKPRTAKSK